MTLPYYLSTEFKHHQAFRLIAEKLEKHLKEQTPCYITVIGPLHLITDVHRLTADVYEQHAIGRTVGVGSATGRWAEAYASGYKVEFFDNSAPNLKVHEDTQVLCVLS